MLGVAATSLSHLALPCCLASCFPQGTAEPLLESNIIVDGLGPGIYAFDGARGRIVRNVIRGCAGVGIKIEVRRDTWSRDVGRVGGEG